jgi:hypothetical protein
MPYHERVLRWDAAQQADHIPGDRAGQGAGAELVIIRAIGDMLTFVEDQLESCGFPIAHDLENPGTDENAEVLLTTRRLLTLSAAGKGNLDAAHILRNLGLTEVTEIFVRLLRLMLAGNGPQPTQHPPQSEQLSLNFAGQPVAMPTAA